jgi:hypothetical protein
MALSPEEQAAWSQMTGKPYQSSGLMDYIPNVFGGVPAGFEGLLGAEQAQQISQRSNIAGLLGAAAALAQGMGSQGPRRSAVQNIIGALGAGYGTAGQVAQQGLQNIGLQYEIAQKQLSQGQALQKQQAINQLMQMPEVTNDPAMKAWIFANPDKALEMFVKRRNMQQFLDREAQLQPAAPQVSPEVAAYKDQMAPYTVSAGANVVPMVEPMREPTQPLAAGTVETAPVPDISGQFERLPAPQVPRPTPTKVAHPLDAEIRKAEALTKYYYGEGNDSTVAKQYEAYAGNLRDRKKQDLLATNVRESLGNINPLFQEEVNTLAQNAPQMTASEIQSGIKDIRKKSSDFKVGTEKELRTEFNGLTEVKEFSTVETAFKQINNALSNPSAANDLAAATKFMKLLDPGSVVRESELGMAMAATGAIDRMQNYFQRLQNGQMLNPAQRADFKRSAELAYQASKDVYNQTAGRYRTLSESYNVDPNNVVLSKGQSKPEPKQTPPRNTKGWQLSVDAQGNRAYVSPDGTQFEEVK